MENASKALLIAGAILIVILIIGIGMIVYQSATGTVDEAVSQMSSQEMQMFNQQFMQYAGNSVSGSNVKALIQKVEANNVQNPTGAKHINLTGVTNTNDVVTAGKYTVTVEDKADGYAGDGLKDTISITYNTTSTKTPPEE